jgi:hypothetical protein
MDISLAAHIRGRRLARCYADLDTSDDPVGEIATVIDSRSRAITSAQMINRPR